MNRPRWMTELPEDTWLFWLLGITFVGPVAVALALWITNAL